MSKESYPSIRAALLDWYDQNKRDLPWRENPTPYRVWISEIMLQQTQVEAVRPYYARWMTRFPTVESLAAADLDDVLATWSGLGYYRRARYLHAAAATIVHDGGFPTTAKALQTLPGVGRYTAGAIASVAFGRRASVVDGNVKRVFARLFEIEGDPSRGPFQRRAWHFADELVPDDRAGDHNQAVMELGATICRPKNPRCDICPLNATCKALAVDRVRELPAPKAKRRRHRVIEGAVVITIGMPERVLLARRTANLLGGMWSLPTTELFRCQRQDRTAGADPSLDAFFGADVRARVEKLGRDITGRSPSEMTPLAPVDHIFTHIDYTLVPWRFSIEAEAEPEIALNPDEHDRHLFVNPEELDALGVPTMIRKVLMRG